MSLRSSLLVAASFVCLGSSATLAGTVTVLSYDMNNGNGTLQNGAFDYFDTKYTGSGDGTKNGSSQVAPTNPPPQQAPQLTGGTGKLTDGIIATQSFSFDPTPYVGWKYQDPTITFHLASGQFVSSVSLYVASSLGASLYLPLVGAPGSVDVRLTNGNVSSAPTFTSSISDYLNNPYTNTSVITLTFGKPISSADVFSLTLNRGELLKDGKYYYDNHVAQYGCDPGGVNCFLDNVNDFKNSAYDVNKEPWILLSEVAFTAAVPEPSTWMMLIAGFAGIGLMAYRRRRSQVTEYAIS